MNTPSAVIIRKAYEAFGTGNYADRDANEKLYIVKRPLFGLDRKSSKCSQNDGSGPSPLRHASETHACTEAIEPKKVNGVVALLSSKQATDRET